MGSKMVPTEMLTPHSYVSCKKPEHKTVRSTMSMENSSKSCENSDAISKLVINAEKPLPPTPLYERTTFKVKTIYQ